MTSLFPLSINVSVVMFLNLKTAETKKESVTKARL